MSHERLGSRLAALLGTLTPKTKQPASAAVLNQWIAQAEGKLGPEAKGGRLGWLVASSVAIACVQRAVDADERQLFLLKGAALCCSIGCPLPPAQPRTSTGSSAAIWMRFFSLWKRYST